MEEKLKNKKLKLEEKQIFEIIIDLAVDAIVAFECGSSRSCLFETYTILILPSVS